MKRPGLIILALVLVIGAILIILFLLNSPNTIDPGAGTVMNPKDATSSGSSEAGERAITKEMTIKMGVYGDLETAYTAVKNTDAFKKKFPKLKLEFQSSDFSGHHDRLMTQIAANEGANDIEVLEIGHIARFVKEGGFTDLSKAPYNGKEAGKDLVKFGMSNAETVDGKLVALPVDIAPAVFFYRKSIADKSGVKLENIGSWEEYIQKGKQLTIDKDGDGKIDQFALANALDVSVIPLNGGKGDWFKSKEPLEPADRFKAVLKLCKQIRDAKIDAQFPDWSGEWMNSFKEGVVVTMFHGAWLAGHFKSYLAPNTAGDWRIDYPPGKIYSSFGGTYLGIPEQTKKDIKGYAFEVIKFFTTNPDAQLKSLEVTSAFPALTTVFDHSIMSMPDDFFGGQKVRLIYQDIAKNIPVQRVSEYDQLAVDIFNNAIKAVIDDKVPIDDAYNKAKQEIKNQMG